MRHKTVWHGKKPSAPKPAPPPPPPPPPPPVQDVQVTDTAAKKAEALRKQRGGVASTALSDALGG